MCRSSSTATLGVALPLDRPPSLPLLLLRCRCPIPLPPIRSLLSLLLGLGWHPAPLVLRPWVLLYLLRVWLLWLGVLLLWRILLLWCLLGVQGEDLR